MQKTAEKLAIFKEAHKDDIERLATALGKDMGIAGSIFVNAAMHGRIPDGEEAEVRAALARLGGASWWENMGKDYAATVGSRVGV